MDKNPKRSPDEIVDGPRLAARILNQYPEERRKKLLSAIQSKSPETFKKIEANILAFEDVVHVSARGIQLLMKEVEYNELLLALSTADLAIRSVFFQNVSERKLQVMREDLAALKNAKPEDVTNARRHIVQKLDALRTSGAVHLVGGEDAWA